jgi:hypothetical protein
MAQPPSPQARTRRPRLLILWLGVLVLGVGLCYILYECSPAGWVYFVVTSEDFSRRAQALAPEYDQLNDDLLQSLPVYPDASLLPESLMQRGPGHNLWPPGGPAEPRALEACFRTRDSPEQVAAFYQDVLDEKGWNLFKEVLDYDGNFVRRGYSKDRACIELHSHCILGSESDGETAYQIRVYYDLNVLLGFPHIPKFMYWLDEVAHCP